jgi:hypothetical protein
VFGTAELGEDVFLLLKRLQSRFLAGIEKRMNAVDNIVSQFFEVARRIRCILDDSTVLNVEWETLCLLSRTDENYVLVTGDGESKFTFGSWLLMPARHIVADLICSCKVSNGITTPSSRSTRYA